MMRVAVCIAGKVSIADMLARTLLSQAAKKYAIQSICYPPKVFERRYAVAGAFAFCVLRYSLYEYIYSCNTYLNLCGCL